MEEQILRFAEQFAWNPDVVRAERLPERPSSLIVCGMGGSHLGARVLLRHDPTLPLSVHSDYGLPRVPAEQLRTALIVASSYSGETEETLDAAKSAVAAGLAVAVITTGGTLARYAEEHALPLILIPKGDAEPRMAVGTFMLALARLLQSQELEEEIRATGTSLDVQAERASGEVVAKRLVGSIPLIYASTLNMSLAYFWKIAFNETSKAPAFYNVFPEVCHNELSGFDNTVPEQALSSHLHILFLKDSDDHPRIAGRMRVMQELLAARGVATTDIELAGTTGLEKALNGILLGVWTAVALAKEYQAPDAATPLIALFKSKKREL